METFVIADAFWADILGIVLLVLGAALLWRGLSGGRDGVRGLLRTRDGTLGRIEGFRLVLAGLVLLGVSAAVIWQARWLLFLALGFGFVEILESSAVIAVWKWDRRRAGMAHADCR